MSTIAQVLERQQKIGFKQVLVAEDFSGTSERALDYALQIVRRYGSALSIVNAIPPDTREAITCDPLPPNIEQPQAKAESAMKLLIEKKGIGQLRPQVTVRQGRVWDVLTSEIHRENTDLLVLGTHGRGGLSKLTIGSIAEEVLRLAPCPVLTIGPNVPPPPTTGFKNIFFATDFGPASYRALPYAVSLAEDYGAKLFFLHMITPLQVVDIGPAAFCPGVYAARDLIALQTTMKEESLQKMKALLPPGAKLAQRPEYIVGIDFLPEALLNAAALHHADLIVMGAKRASSARVAAHLSWSVTHEIICKAKCTILTVTV
jgi:nucleotide-binding universal stress UspA family protein